MSKSNVLKDVKVLFSNLSKVDDYSNKYQLVVEVTEEQAADLEEAGVTVKNKEYDGKLQYRVTFKTKYAARVVQADGRTEHDLAGGELGRNSKVNVQYNLREWSHMGKSGVSQDLVGVQIKRLEAQNELAFESEDDDDI